MDDDCDNVDTHNIGIFNGSHEFESHEFGSHDFESHEFGSHEFEMHSFINFTDIINSIKGYYGILQNTR
jgi:hypothetical protein